MKYVKARSTRLRFGSLILAPLAIALAACGDDPAEPFVPQGTAGSGGSPPASAGSGGAGPGDTQAGAPSGGVNPMAGSTSTVAGATGGGTGMMGSAGNTAGSSSTQGGSTAGSGGAPMGGGPAAGMSGMQGGADPGTAGMSGAAGASEMEMGGDGAGGAPMMPEEPGGPAEADPSDGCGKAGPQTGSSGQPLTVSGHQYYVKLPMGYDENKPYPVVIMFNPTGNPITWAEQSAGFEAVAQAAIRIYPHMANQNNGWGPGDADFFGPFYEKITTDYCIDKARVFAAGESSGGEFAGHIGCEHGDKLRSVAPGAPKAVGQWSLNASQRNCQGNVMAVVIHSPKDNVLAQPVGEEMRDFFRDLNSCTDMSEPVEGYTDDLSNCVMYQGCDEGYPVYWCHHNDPEYNNTYHGWPHFAAKMLWETWSAL